MKQKRSTLKYCARNGLGVTASTGSIVVYRKAKAHADSTKIMLVDPPAAGDDGISSVDELAAVLNYYHNVYSVTHTDFVEQPNDRIRRLSIATWLARIIQILNDGGRPPESAPSHLSVRPRVYEIGHEGSRYGGTIFDQRLTRESVRKYRDFDNATSAIRSPVRFVGLSEEVTTLITSCQWNQLLDYRDTGFTGQRLEGTAILTSGMMVRDLPRTQERENASRHEFEVLRKLALKMRDLPL